MKRRLSENLRRVHERIAAACERAGRSPSEVQLIAVTKSVGVDVIRQLFALGYTDLGESRVQDLIKRAAMLNESYNRHLGDPGAEPLTQGGGSAAGALHPKAQHGPQVTGERMPKPSWHMVGHLQRNKVKAVLPWVKMIHSVDSLRLAEDINTQAGRLGRQVPILLQVNVGGEKSKFGVAVGAAVHLVEQLVALPNLELSGLMTLAPLTDDRAFIRNCFTRLRELLDDIRHERFAPPKLCHLSMGMSHDFELAVEEGATLVRIGSALFDGIEQFAESA